MSEGEHYLKQELYQRFKEDDQILDFIQAGSLDGLWFWDIEQPEEEWMSPEFKALFGYDDHEIPNNSAWWQANIHPDDLPIALKNFERHCADPEHPYDQVVRYRHKNGSTVWVRCRGIAIRDDNDKPIRMLGCHQDITQLMQTQESLNARTLELERSNKALDEFAYVASHDLKEPLRGLTNYAQFLMEDYADALDDDGRRMLDTMQSQVKRMDRLIGTLLEYSRVGRQGVRLGNFSMFEAATMACENLNARIDGDNVDMRISEALPEVCSDPVLVQQILQNLISNGIKYNDSEAKIIEVGFEPGSPGRFFVRDNGIGIRDDMRDRVFQIFKRLHARDQYGGGTGAGLTIAQKIVHLLGGEIWIESKPGQGSCFWFTLEAG